MSKVVKTNEEILKSLKKSNKMAREKSAQKAGFSNYDSYVLFLEGNGTLADKKTASAAPKKVSSFTEKEKNTLKAITAIPKPIIHIVDILDASSSMGFGGGKYKVATNGILESLVPLRADNTVNYTYTFVEFIDAKRIKEHLFMSKSFPEKLSFSGARGGDTPLYKTVYDVITKLQHSNVLSTDKVLIKVYTDGEDNSSRGFRAPLAELIKKVNSENFTVTFMAEQRDLNNITSNLNVDESNTFAITNDAAGFKKGFQESIIATMSYTANVKENKSVLRGFYKKVGTL